MEVDPTTPSEVNAFNATKLVANFANLELAQDAQKHCTKIISSNEALKGASRLNFYVVYYLVWGPGALFLSKFK